MTDIKVVIGSNFGDEGKGLFVHKFAYDAKLQNKKCLVVMSNGGAQRGHTVDLSSGISHIFKHFGSGTFDGADTYYSSYFILNPMEFMKEYNDLVDNYKIFPKVYCCGACHFSTPFDMIVNQIVEEHRGENKHGSCGMGIWETVYRYSVDKSTATINIWNFLNLQTLQQNYAIKQLRDNYFIKRLKEHGINKIPDKWKEIYYSEDLINHYLADLARMGSRISFQPKWDSYDTIIFENGQGLLLDGDNTFYGDNTTPSHTGCLNAYKIIKNNSNISSDSDIELCYVSRSYMTRHGAGKFLTECDKSLINPNMFDVHNLKNEFQGELRYGELNVEGLLERIKNDSKIFYMGDFNVKTSIGITHMNEHFLDLSKLNTDGKIYSSDSPYIQERDIKVEKI